MAMSMKSSASTSKDIPSVHRNDTGEVFRTILPGPTYLAQSAGYVDGQLQFIRHTNGDISANQWSAARRVWENIGHFSSTRKRIEGLLEFDHLEGETAHQTFRHDTLPYFDAVAKQREAVSQNVPIGLRDFTTLMASAAVGRGDAIKVRATKSTPAFGTALPIDTSSSKFKDQSPSFAIDRALADRARAAGLYDIEVRDKAWLTRYQNTAASTADAVKSLGHTGRRSGQVTYNSFGAITSDRLSNVPPFLNLPHGQGCVEPQISSEVPPLSEFPFLPKTNRTSVLDADRNSELKESLHKLASQAEKRNGQTGAGRDEPSSPASLSLRQQKPEHSQAWLLPDIKPRHEGRSIRPPPGLEQMDFTDRFKADFSSNNVLSTKSPWAGDVDVQSLMQTNDAHGNNANMLQASGMAAQSDIGVDYSTILSQSRVQTRMIDWTRETRDRFRRHEFIYQQLLDESDTAKSLLGGQLNSHRQAAEAKVKRHGFDMTRLLLPVIENLASYVTGPVEQRRGYFAPWSDPPDHAIDHEATGNLGAVKPRAWTRRDEIGPFDLAQL